MRVDAFVEQMIKIKENRRRSATTPAEREDYEKHGKLGEVAFGKAFGWPVNFIVGHGGDEGDFTLLNGNTIEVKSVRIETNKDHDFRLVVGKHERPADFYVLVLIATDYSQGLIAGFVTREKFCREHGIEKGWGHCGPNEPYIMLKSKLSREYPEIFWNVKN